MSAIIEFIAAAILIFGLGKSGQIPDVGFNIESALLILVMFVFVRFIINLAYLPAKIFNEQGGFIENPFDITTLSLDTNQPDFKWATFKVTNVSKTSRVEDCYLELIDIFDLESNQSLQFETQKITWSSRESDIPAFALKKPIVLYPDTPVWCIIAYISIPDNIAYFSTWYPVNTNHSELKPGNYRLTIKAHGRYKNNDKSFLFSLDLSYDLSDANRFRIESIKEITSVK